MHSLDVAALGRLLSVQACVPSKNKSKQWKDISDTKFYFHYDTLFMFRITKLVKKETQCMSNLSVDWTCFNDSITQKLIFPHLGQVAHSGTWVYLIHVHLLVTHVGFLFGLHTSRMFGASKSMDFYIEKIVYLYSSYLRNSDLSVYSWHKQKRSIPYGFPQMWKTGGINSFNRKSVTYVKNGLIWNFVTSLCFSY